LSELDWSGYAPFDPKVDRPLNEVPRQAAVDAFDLLMSSRSERQQQLRRLIANNGVDTLDTSDESIEKLNGWFKENVRGDPATGRLLPQWYSVVNDIALFLGDAIVGRCPTLHWSLFTHGSRDAAYQRHVIMGFTRVANPKYNVDIDLLVATYGHRIVRGLEVKPNAFLKWLSGAAELA
jgi:hypothetical protein